MSEYTTYPTATKLIAELVDINVRMMSEIANVEVTPEQALESVIGQLYEDKYDARHRVGKFKCGMTSEEKYQADFLAMVAHDAELGTHRPSVGNVREAILNKVKA